MASTYSNLKIELIGTGDQTGTWGTTTNTNLGTAIEEAIVGYAAANFTSDADLTLTLTDTNATQVARNFVLNATSSGSLTATRNLIVPTIEKPYVVFNNTTGSQSITVKTSAGTGITIPSGKKALLITDGTNVVDAITYLSNLTLGSTLGVTGATTLSSTLGVTGATTLSSDLTLNAQSDLRFADADSTNWVAFQAPATVTTNVTWTLPSADGTSGQALVTNGSGTLSFSDAGDVTGPASATDNALVRFDGTTGKIIQNSGITINDSNVVSGATISGSSNTLTVDGTNVVGFKAVPAVGTKTTSYTLATGDVGKYVQVGSGGSITIPDATFSEGDAVSIFNNTSGNITITCSITTAYIAGTDADKSSVTLSTRGVATILFISGTVCVITGNVS